MIDIGWFTVGSWIAMALLQFGLCFAGVSKLLFPSPKPEAMDSLLQRIAQHELFALAQLFGGIALFAGCPSGVEQSLIGALVLVVLLGMINAVARGESCNCFGSLSAKSLRWSLLIDAMFLVSGISVLSAPYFLTPEHMPWLWQLTTIIITFVITAAVIQHKRKALKDELNKKRAFSPASLDGEKILGTAADISQIKLKQIAREGQPIFLVGISSRCDRCRKLMGDLVRLARAFTDQVSVVVISDSETHRSKYQDDSFTLLVDPERNFATSLGIESVPFAILANANLTQMAPPCLGANPVRSLFAIMLNARAD